MFVKDNNSFDLKFNLYPFLTESAYNKLYLPGKTIFKISHVVLGYFKRSIHLFQCIRSDYVLIHREATPLGPPIFEWLIAKVFRKKIVFDFDDAIWLANTSDENSISARLKWHYKFNSICKWSYKIAAGNEFLANKARQFNNKVFVIPTVVDTSKRYLPNKSNSNQGLVTVGWTGSHSTASYVTPIIPLLRKLNEKYSFRFLFISNQEPKFSLPQLEFRKWNKNTEIADLNEMDIGIMPLPVDDWSRGKCGFKLIQYLSLCIPSIATNIPPNDKIIIQNESGFLCDSEADWMKHLEDLILNEDKRRRFGENGRGHIENNYSKKACADKFFTLFS